MTEYEKAVALWKRKKIQTDAELSAALSGIRVSFAYNSGKIENDNITYNNTREIFDHDRVTAYTGDLRTLFEIRNAKDADELFLYAFGQKRRTDEDFIKEMQYCLTKNTYDERRWRLGERPGEYKHHDYVTGREETGAAPEDVHEEMNELLSELIDLPDDKILTAAAYFHAKFENIHPFADGNGRTGRLAMNYLLVTHNHPVIVIYEEDRKAYYQALEEWDRYQRLDILEEFLKSQAVKTWSRQMEREDHRNHEKSARSGFAL